MKRVVTTTLLAAALLVNAHGFASCEESPSRIVKLVVGAPAGGGIDIVAPGSLPIRLPTDTPCSSAHPVR
jgi:tripartite-type tricarboxylate transporter receptor subunit TctC